MNIFELWPDASTFTWTMAGNLSVCWESPHCANVCDSLYGFHIMRVEFDASESAADSSKAMDSLLSMAEIKYRTLKERHEHTLDKWPSLL